MKKTNKLRHAEYYSMQSLLDQLYMQSKNGNNFYKLTRLMQKEENIRLAYRNIKKNMGSHTAGADGKTIADIEKLTINEVVSRIRSMFQWYEPGKVRRVYIPKPDGRKRPLGIPSIWDRLFQQCILQILEPICEAKFHSHSYGFRPNRNAHHAFARVNHFLNNKGHGSHYCVDMDIKGFFDNVNHGKLLKQMWALGIREKKFLSIISVLLKAEIAGEGIPTKGTPQGGILSPLLANIVLNELDWWVSDQWETVKTIRKYTTPLTAIRAFKRQNKRMKECRIVRYADDFKIICRDYPTALKMYYATKDFLETRLKLEISPEKTKIVNLRKQNSEFLGFSIRVKKKGSSYVAYSHMSDKAKKNAHEKIKQAIKKIAKEQSRESVWRYNTVVMGIHNYYEVATHISKDLGKLSQHFTKILYNRLRRDWKPAQKSDLSETLYKRYGRYNPKWYKAHDMIIIPIYAWKHRYAIQFNRAICSYTEEGRKLIHDNLMIIDREVLRHVSRTYCEYRSIEYNDNRISKFVSQRGKCAISGIELGLRNWECHHRKPLKVGGTDKYDNLIIILESFHKAIHKSDQTELQALMKSYQLPDEKRALCSKLYELANQ